MTQHVFKYRLSRQRLQQLLRSIHRNARRKLLFAVLGIGTFVGALVVTGFYSEELESYSPEILKFLYAFLLLSFMFVLGVLFQPSKNNELRQPSAEEDVELMREDGGLRFATDGAEYFVKWRGITRLWLEPDGFAIAHHQLYFFIPDSAFASRDEKLALMQAIYDNISDAARSATRAQFGPTASSKAG